MKKLKKTLLVLALIFISVSVIAGPTRPGLIRISKVGHEATKKESLTKSIFEYAKVKDLLNGHFMMDAA